MLLNNFIILAKFNLIQKQLDQFNWEKLGESLITHVLQIILITLLFIILNRLGKKLLSQSMSKYRTENGGSARGDTVFVVIMNTFKYAVLFLYLYVILSNIGVPVGTLIAGAGIVSIAIGLGAQGLVSDLINGTSILIEGQLRVGDQVTLQTIDGTVTAIGLRTIQLKDSNGTIHFVPNRSIMTISNHSRGTQRAFIFIELADISQLELAKNKLKSELNNLIQQSDKIKSSPIIEAPSFDPKNNKIGLTVSVKVAAGFQAPMTNLLLKHTLDVLTANDITLK